MDLYLTIIEWKLNRNEKYVFLLWTLISIKQNKEVVNISDKKYDLHNVETETWTLFIGLTEPFIQLTLGIE